ncbi:MAG: ABC transporter permease, partial [Lachnospiraceae bacterium]|nr:ABC transporter permease [Lachnospiraceae bacterium]
MLVNHDVTDMMENIPDEKFKIIGIDKDAEAPSRPRVGYWRDAWRRLRENKVAFVALIILLILIFFI